MRTLSRSSTRFGNKRAGNGSQASPLNLRDDVRRTDMQPKPDRRTFLAGLGAAGAALATMGATSPTTRPHSKNKDVIVVGMIGTGGRGTELAGSYAGMSDVIVH